MNQAQEPIVEKVWKRKNGQFRHDTKVDDILETFSYDPESGDIVWKKKGHRKTPGQLAGSNNKADYRRLRVKGAMVLAHRAAWVLMTGEWPSQDIDHIDGDPHNNAWSNLRQATASQNCFNQRVRRKHSTGHKGVYRQPSGKWSASICGNGRQIYLGTFALKEDAIIARQNAAIRLHGEFARF